MTRAIEEPKETGEDHLGKRFAHPAFGQIAASRVHGRTTLYGSDFVHQHFVRVSIGPSELVRGLSKDWHHAKLRGIIEVDMSESQWATFVSSMNVGTGTPCTITTKDGVQVPGFPLRTQDDAFKHEMRGKLSDSVDRLKELREKVSTGNSSAKARNETLTELAMVIQELQSNLPFVADSFDEHVEKKVEAAKAEVHGYMTGHLQARGIEAIRANMPLALEDRTAKD